MNVRFLDSPPRVYLFANCKQFFDFFQIDGAENPTKESVQQILDSHPYFEDKEYRVIDDEKNFHCVIIELDIKTLDDYETK